jgi:hypothetical protein
VTDDLSKFDAMAEDAGTRRRDREQHLHTLDVDDPVTLANNGTVLDVLQLHRAGQIASDLHDGQRAMLNERFGSLRPWELPLLSTRVVVGFLH